MAKIPLSVTASTSSPRSDGYAPDQPRARCSGVTTDQTNMEKETHKQLFDNATEMGGDGYRMKDAGYDCNSPIYQASDEGPEESIAFVYGKLGVTDRFEVGMEKITLC